MKTVCALIVTYNRKEYLVKLLDAILNQEYTCSKVVIFDNFSSDGTQDKLIETGYVKRTCENLGDKGVGQSYCQKNNIEFIYVRNEENEGGAGGFHKGIQIASESGCNLIWTMDDDVCPSPDCLRRLVAQINAERRMVIPNRSGNGYLDHAIIDVDMKNPFKYGIGRRKHSVPVDKIQCDVISVCDMPFEGPLFETSLVREIGLPKKELFIIFDDTEYCKRACEVTDVGFVKGAILYKQILKEVDHKALMGWKDYYGYRNQYWYDRTYGENYFVKLLRPILNHLDLVFRAIVRRKWSNIKVLNRAYLDGVHGRLGKTVEPGKTGTEF